MEILYNGTWTNICDDVWDDKNSRVVCRQLGFQQVLNVTNFKPEPNVVEHHVTALNGANLSCSGDETNIAYCNGETAFATNEPCESMAYVLLECDDCEY